MLARAPNRISDLELLDQADSLSKISFLIWSVDKVPMLTMKHGQSAQSMPT
jgi:hypothetical protein